MNKCARCPQQASNGQSVRHTDLHTICQALTDGKLGSATGESTRWSVFNGSLTERRVWVESRQWEMQGKSFRTKSKLDQVAADFCSQLKQKQSRSGRNWHWKVNPMGMSFPKHSTAETSPTGLRQLSHEVSRVAPTLARLAVTPAAEASKVVEAQANDSSANVP